MRERVGACVCVRERERVQTDWIHSFDVMYIRWNSIERFGQEIVHGASVVRY